MSMKLFAQLAFVLKGSAILDLSERETGQDRLLMLTLGLKHIFHALLLRSDVGYAARNASG